MPSERQLKVVLVGDSKKLEKTFRRADTAGAKFRDGMKKASKVVVASVAAIAAGSVTAFTSFDDALTKSVSIIDNVTDAMRGDMADAAREVAKVTRFSATEAAQSFFYLASAGLTAAQSIAALPQVSQFATAGAFEMQLATDLLTDAQSALGLTVDDTAVNMANMAAVSDVLVKGNTLANASVQQFSESLTNKAGAAIRAVGKDMEEGVAVLAAFADQGLKGEAAGTALAIVFRDLQTSAIRNTNAWERLGVSTFDASGEMRNMADIVGGLEDVLLGASDKQKKMTLSQLGFKDKSQGFLLSLLGQSNAIRDYEQALRDAGGTTKRVADKQLSSAAAQFDIFKSQAIDAGIALGQDLIPALIDGGKGIQELATWFRELGPAAQVAIKAIAALSVGVAIMVASWPFAALALAAGGIIAIGAAASENRTEVEKLTEDLKALGEVKVETLADVIGRVPEKEIEALDALGVSLEDVRQGLKDNAFQSSATTFHWLEAQGAAGSLVLASGGLMDSLGHLQNQFDDSREAAAKFTERQTLVAAETARVEEAILSGAGGMGSYTEQTQDATTAQDEMAETELEEVLTGVGEAAVSAAQAQRDLTASYLEANDPALALLTAGRDYDAALSDLHETQGDTKASAEDLEAAEIRVFDSFEDLVGATIAFGENDDAIESFRETARLAGLSEEAIDRNIGAIETYNSLQVANKVFRVSALPQVFGQDNFGGFAPGSSTPPSPPTARPVGNVGSVTPFHEGGVVPGRSGQEVPALLEAGEGVISAADMSASGSGPPRASQPTTMNLHIHIEGRSAQTDAQLVEMILNKAAREAKHAGRFSSFG